MPFTSMVDMAQDAEEAKEEMAQPIAASNPVYPYGLCISLTEDEIEKLGMEGLPNVGDLMHIMGTAKVTSVSQNEREMGDGSKKQCCRVELQITHLTAEDEDDEGRTEARRERFYGNGKAA